MTTQTQTSSTPRFSTLPLPVPGGYFFDEDEADRAERFFTDLLIHTKGRWAGSKFKFIPWQSAEFIRPLFGWKNLEGSRRFTTGYLEAPSKSGKSEMAAGIALKLARGDREASPEVYIAAGDKEQAKVIFDVAKAMVEASPQLRKKAKVLRDAIVWDSAIMGAVLRVVSAEAYTKFGLNVHGLIFDELHVQPNRELWDALNEMTGARAQPLTVALTNSGVYDETSICWEQHEYTRRIAQGLVEDPHYLGVIYGADEEADWKSEEVWEAANPSLGITKTKEFMSERAKRAAATPSYLNTFLRLHLGIWTRQMTSWIPLDTWDASASIVDEPGLAGRKCYGGLHVIAATDITAFVLDFPGEEHDVLFRFFVPQDKLKDLDYRTGGMAGAWVREKRLIVTPGDVVDYQTIKATILEEASKYDLRELAFHRFGATQLATELGQEGLTVVPIATSGMQMSAATKEFERLVMAGKYHHGGDAVMRFMMNGVAVRSDTDGNVKIDPTRSQENVSGPVAAVMAISRAVLASEKTSARMRMPA